MVTQAQATPATDARSTAYLRAALLVVAVLAIDQATKHAIASWLAVGQEHKFLPGINLVHVRNTGVAFGFFAGGGTLVLVLTLAALAILLGYFIVRPTRRWLWVPTGLLIGGAVGNLLDRLFDGAVTDFIKLPLWPAFNFADMSITVGVLALLWVLEGERTDGR